MVDGGGDEEKMGGVGGVGGGGEEEKERDLRDGDAFRWMMTTKKAKPHSPVPVLNFRGLGIFQVSVSRNCLQPNG